MTWALPAALALGALAALPLIAHLWSRRTPRRQPFPTLRFLRAASPVSRRLRTVQDWPLLCLRAGIVLAIATAAAGPTIATQARQSRWQSRLHRVIVVQEEQRSGLAADLARLQRDASSSEVVQTGESEVRLARATHLAARAAAEQRTELVVLWDGTHGALPRRALSRLPPAVGIVLQPGAATRTTAPRFAPGATLPLDLVVTDRDREAASALHVALGLVPGAATAPRVRAIWPGAAITASELPAAAEAPVRRALAHLADDVRLRDAAWRSTRDARAAAMRFPAGARVLARAPDGVPLLRAWADADRLVIALEAEPTSPLALWASVAALDAVAMPQHWSSAAPDEAWTPADIASVTRDASMPEARPLPGGLDTRAAWALALALLVVEQWWRARLAAERHEETAGLSGNVEHAA